MADAGAEEELGARRGRGSALSGWGGGGGEGAQEAAVGEDGFEAGLVECQVGLA